MVEMKAETLFSYNEEDDILLLHKANENAKGCVQIGDFIIDFSADMKRAVGLEILNASRILMNINLYLSKEQLLSIKSASLKTEHKGDAIYVYFGLVFMRNQKEEALNSLVTLARPICAF